MKQQYEIKRCLSAEKYKLIETNLADNSRHHSCNCRVYFYLISELLPAGINLLLAFLTIEGVKQLLFLWMDCWPL